MMKEWSENSFHSCTLSYSRFCLEHSSQSVRDCTRLHLIVRRNVFVAFSNLVIKVKNFYKVETIFLFCFSKKRYYNFFVIDFLLQKLSNKGIVYTVWNETLATRFLKGKFNC
jgi:hypothetical protein